MKLEKLLALPVGLGISSRGLPMGWEANSTPRKGDQMKIRLIDGGNRKIAAIKAIRVLTGKNLKDAKNLVDRAPVTFECQVGDPSHYRRGIQELRDSGARFEAQAPATAIDKLTAASYISTAEVALGEGNVTEARNCLRSALRLLGDFLDDVQFLGVEDQL